MIEFTSYVLLIRIWRFRMNKKIIINFFAVVASLAVVILAFGQKEAGNDWPVVIKVGQDQVEIYSPQTKSLQDNKMTGVSAVSVTPYGKVPIFGAIWFSALLDKDVSKNSYSIKNIAITKVKIPNYTPPQEKQFSTAIESTLPTANLRGSLDALQSSFESTQKEQEMTENLNTTPPTIKYVKYPAVLIVIDGEPKTQAVEGTKLMRVINTPALMVFDPSTKKYYISSGSVWYTTSSISSEWQVDSTPPKEISSIVTQKDSSQKIAASDKMPRIIVATTPTELISSDGEPKYSPIQGTNLLFMSNTESDVVMDISSQDYFVLISGRWYKSNSLDGAWDFVSPDKLPSDFSKIPAKSTKGSVLASVPNTQEAQEALYDAEMPKTSAIKRSEAKLTVEYDGEPQFEKIKGTSISYALNTKTQVLLIDGKYYACDKAVWFVAISPYGPWVIADSIPLAIQDIPPDSPVYNVKYVYIYDYTPDVVFVGYTPGYLGWYPYYGTVVYGTGFVYQSWYGRYYYPRMYTFGFGVHFRPIDGWVFGFGLSPIFYEVGMGWNYGFGNYGWWGPHNYGWYSHGFHHGRYYFGNRFNFGHHRYRFEGDFRRNIYHRMENMHRNDHGFMNRMGRIHRFEGRRFERHGGGADFGKHRMLQQKFNRNGFQRKMNGGGQFDRRGGGRHGGDMMMRGAGMGGDRMRRGHGGGIGEGMMMRGGGDRVRRGHSGDIGEGMMHGGGGSSWQGGGSMMMHGGGGGGMMRGGSYGGGMMHGGGGGGHGGGGMMHGGGGGGRGR